MPPSAGTFYFLSVPGFVLFRRDVAAKEYTESVFLSSRKRRRWCGEKDATGGVSKDGASFAGYEGGTGGNARRKSDSRPIPAGSNALVPTGQPIRSSALGPGVKPLTVSVKILTVVVGGTGGGEA